MSNIQIHRIIFELSQEGNTLGTTDEFEELDVSFEYQAGKENGSFITLKTGTGWSIENPNEIFETIGFLHDIVKKIEREI